MKIIYSLAFLLLLQVLVACDQSLESPKGTQLSNSQQKQKKDKALVAPIVFQSADDGQTWQDISNGLPKNLGEDDIQGKNFFASEKGLFVKIRNGLYHNTAKPTAPFWTKESAPEGDSSVATGKSEIFTYDHWGVNLKTTNGTSVWSPMFNYSHEPRIRSVFETAGGTVFLGTNMGIFKTDNSGKTWKHVYIGGYVGHLAELNGVLLATGMKRIIRSTDNGETWATVDGDGAVAWDVKPIKGGFAAVFSSSESNPRRLRTSYDEGKTWQPIGPGLRDKAFADSISRTWNDRPHLQRFSTSIIQVGKKFFCTHPDGIFRSEDKGITWQLVLPAIKGKVLNLSVSGNVIYAVPLRPEC